MRGNRNVGLLIVFLLITVAMAVAFFPSVNQNVAEGLNAIAPIDTESLDGATRTIFDSISYARSIHILAMLLVGGTQAYTVVWDLGDVGIGLMTIFNMLALVPLSGEALTALNDYEKRKKIK